MFSLHLVQVALLLGALQTFFSAKYFTTSKLPFAAASINAVKPSAV
jgi:hypothetical protein